MADIDLADPSAARRAPRDRRSRRGVTAGVVFACGVAGFVGAWSGTELGAGSDSPPRRPSTLGLEVAAPRGVDPPSLGPVDVADVAARIGPSVVAIQRPLGADGTGESSGTGIVVTPDGEIVTNAHVVGDADVVNVRLPGESEPRAGAVLATDPANDLALVRIAASGLEPAVFAAPDDVRVGDDVVAVGFSLGLDGDPSVTRGIVAALDRSLTTADGVLNGLVQTDAAISSGNSGGPLVDTVGRVVGINTAIAYGDTDTAANSVGFAISVAELLPELAALREAALGTVVPDGYLGVGLAPRRDGGLGAVIVQVELGSPADAGGLLVGDVVVGLDGGEVLGDADLIATVRDRRPGEQLVVDVVRGDLREQRTVTLGARGAD